MLLEIILQIIALVFAFWMLKDVYEYNKKAKPVTFKGLTTWDAEQMKEASYAKAFFLSLLIIVFILARIFTCGFVCGV